MFLDFSLRNSVFQIRTWAILFVFITFHVLLLQTTATLPQIPFATLEKRQVLGTGSFGEVCLSWWESGHVDVAVKVNGVSCVNVAAIDNERKLLERMLQHPHKNILVVYGIVTDAPDGNVRLVMAHCSGGSLDGYLNTVRESGHVRTFVTRAPPDIGYLLKMPLCSRP